RRGTGEGRLRAGPSAGYPPRGGKAGARWGIFAVRSRSTLPPRVRLVTSTAISGQFPTSGSLSSGRVCHSVLLLVGRAVQLAHSLVHEVPRRAGPDARGASTPARLLRLDGGPHVLAQPCGASAPRLLVVLGAHH